MAVARNPRLSVAARRRAAHPKRLTRANEDDLIRVADDVVPADVPDKEPSIRQADLEVRAVSCWSPVRGGGDSTQVFDKAERQIEHPSA
jgi:hypothetical protein